MKVEYAEKDIAWAAGIIEGEGCFRFYKIKNRKNSYSCGITVIMSDKDVLEKLRDILKTGTLRPKNIYVNKPLWNWSVQNHKGTFDTLLRIMPYLGERRLKRASELFEWLEPRVVK